MHSSQTVTVLTPTVHKVYKAHTGINLTLSRIDRRELDRLFIRFPPPQPPVKTRSIWGGYQEEFLDHNDEEYIEQYNAWLIQISNDELAVMSKGIELPEGVTPDNNELFTEIKKALHITGDDKLNFLQLVVLDEKDFQEVTRIILYLSTVTQEGIDQACAFFSVEWNHQPIDTWAVKHSNASYSQFLDHREAARFSFMDWNTFCSLTGPEQSMIVAHYKLINRIQHLEARSG